MSTTARVFVIPKCDVHGKSHPAKYDARVTIGGRSTWAYVCHEAMIDGGGEVGLGRGQRLLQVGTYLNDGAEVVIEGRRNGFVYVTFGKGHRHEGVTTKVPESWVTFDAGSCPEISLRKTTFAVPSDTLDKS